MQSEPVKPSNEFEGIVFATRTGQYAATIPNGIHVKVIGHFPTIFEAIDARRAALDTEGKA
jgi:hypothetical protein